MLEHLNRVVEICHKIGYECPMIWSDMFFRIQNPDHAYRSATCEIPQSVIDQVPEGVELVYWDYYSWDRDLIKHMFDCHVKFHNPLSYAAGAWRWFGFAPHNRYSIKVSEPELDACEKYGVDRITVTAWGDDGSDAAQFSSMASALYFAERSYHGATDDAWLGKRCEMALGVSLNNLLLLDAPNYLPEYDVYDVVATCKQYFYNDILERTLDCHVDENTAHFYADRAKELLALSDAPNFGYIYDTLGKLCRVLSVKVDMGWRLHNAYKAGDKEALRRIAECEIPDTVKEIKSFLEAFRRQWLIENKSFGLLTHEKRIGGVIERLNSVAWQIGQYLSGNLEKLEELESDPLPYSFGSRPYRKHVLYRSLFTGIY
jgi:hypothetical protein